MHYERQSYNFSFSWVYALPDTSSLYKTFCAGIETPQQILQTLPAAGVRRHVRHPKPVINWKTDDYAVLDGDRVIGRIYKEALPAGVKWRWSLYMVGTPNSGNADTLDEAQAALAEVYERRK